MKVKIFLSSLVKRWITHISTDRGGHGIDCQKWDNMYDSVISGRMERYSSK